MKRIFVVAAVMATIIASASMAFGFDVNASGTVSAVCDVSGAPALAFGGLDAVTDAGGATAVVTAPTIYCSSGASVAVSDDLGANESGAQMRLKNGVANFINYSISYTTPLNGSGMAVNIGGVAGLNLTADIPAGALDNAPAGIYNDTVVITLTP